MNTEEINIDELAAELATNPRFLRDLMAVEPSKPLVCACGKEGLAPYFSTCADCLVEHRLAPWDGDSARQSGREIEALLYGDRMLVVSGQPQEVA